MILIAHRGNIFGPIPERENNPEYIDEALHEGFFCEIDIRASSKSDYFFIGHDYGEYELPISWFEERKEKLFLHAKDLKTLSYFSSRDDSGTWHVFWHQEDAYTLTLSGIIWAYPGSAINSSCICVMPEKAEYRRKDLKQCFGICSDDVASHRDELKLREHSC